MVNDKQSLWSRDFILACLANFLMSSSFYLLMPTLPAYLTKAMGLPESKVGVVLATYVLAMLLARPFSGFLIDSFDRKRMFLLGLAVFTLLFGGYLLAGSVLAFMVLRFMHGAAWGVNTVSGNTIAIDIIPSSRRAQGIGVYGLSMNLSMAVAPWAGLRIYALGFGYLVGACLLAGAAAWLIVWSMRVPPRPKAERSGLSLDRFILLRALPVTVNLMLCAVSYGMIVSYGALYAEELDIGADFLYLFMALGIGLSRVVSGRLVDRGRIHLVALLSIGLLTASLAMFSLLHNTGAFCVSSLLIGVGFGSMVPAFQTLFVNMGRHNQRGTANSTYLVSFDLGLGLGMLLGGFVSKDCELQTAYLLGGALCMLSIPYYYFITRPLYERKKLV